MTSLLVLPLPEAYVTVTTLLNHCNLTLTVTVTGDRPNAPKLLPSAADWNDGLWTGACAVLRQQAVVCDGSAVPDVCVGLGGKAPQEQCHSDSHTFGPSLQDALVYLKRSGGKKGMNAAQNH